MTGRAIGEGVAVDDEHVGREIAGMAERDFDPHNPPSGDFQTRVG